MKTKQKHAVFVSFGFLAQAVLQLHALVQTPGLFEGQAAPGVALLPVPPRGPRAEMQAGSP